MHFFFFSEKEHGQETYRDMQRSSVLARLFACSKNSWENMKKMNIIFLYRFLLESR